MSEERPPRSDVRIRALLERCYHLIEDGKPVDFEQICHAEPDLLPRLRKLIERDSELVRHLRGRPRGDGLRDGVVGEFELLGLLGQGGMGEVWRARQASLGREVALKILHGGLDGSARRRFLREAGIAAAIDHPHVIPIHAVGEDAGVAWIAMKLIDGPSLAQLDRPLAGREVARIGIAVARALHDAHLSGVIHRDVKPANVMLDGDRPVLLDFGLARELGAEKMTADGSVPGTLLYMSPEQAAGRALDPRTDVYSLCATLYEAYSGEPPFDVTGPESLVRAIRFTDPAPLRVARGEVDLATIIHRGLCKEPDRRFASAADLADDLELFVAARPIRSRPAGAVERAWRFVRRRPAVAIPTAAFLLLLVVVSGVSLYRDRQDRLAADADLAAIHATLDEGRILAATGLLRALRNRAPAARGIERASRRIEAETALATLAEEVIARTHGARFEALRRLRDEVADAGAGFDPWPLRDVALAIAAHRIGETDAFARDVAELEEIHGPSRTLEALARLAEAEGVIDPTTLPPARALGRGFSVAIDRVLAALIVRTSGGRLETQRDALLAARREAPESYHVRYALAVLHHEEGDFRLAQALLLGLVSEGRYRPVVLRSLALQSLALNDPETARRRLDSIEPEDRNAGWAIVDIECAQVTESADRVLIRIEDHLQRDPGLEPLLLKAAQASLDLSDPDETLLFVERALGSGKYPRIRHALRIWRLGAEIAVMRREPGGPGHDDLVDCLDEAHELEAEATGAVGRSDALVLKSRIQELLGRHAVAAATLEDGLEVSPENPGGQLLFAARVARRALAAARQDLSMPPAEDVARARRMVLGVLDGNRPTSRPATPLQYDQALEYAAILTLADGDAMVLDAARKLHARRFAVIPPRVADVIESVVESIRGRDR